MDAFRKRYWYDMSVLAVVLVMSLAAFGFLLCFVYSGRGAVENCGERLNDIAYSVHKVAFEGHDYIWVKSGFRGGLCHNPECRKCKGKEAAE